MSPPELNKGTLVEHSSREAIQKSYGELRLKKKKQTNEESDSVLSCHSFTPRFFYLFGCGVFLAAQAFL